MQQRDVNVAGLEVTLLENIPKIDGEFYYLASPYGDRNPEVVEGRMNVFEYTDARLSSLGHFTWSPLDKHYKLKQMNLPGDYNYWKHYCIAMLKKSVGLIVITQLGWDTAPGVQDEIEKAKKFGLPIYYV